MMVQRRKRRQKPKRMAMKKRASPAAAARAEAVEADVAAIAGTINPKTKSPIQRKPLTRPPKLPKLKKKLKIRRHGVAAKRPEKKRVKVKLSLKTQSQMTRLREVRLLNGAVGGGHPVDPKTSKIKTARLKTWLKKKLKR